LSWAQDGSDSQMAFSLTIFVSTDSQKLLAEKEETNSPYNTSNAHPFTIILVMIEILNQRSKSNQIFQF
jgi:hypothetical protein